MKPRRLIVLVAGVIGREIIGILFAPSVTSRLCVENYLALLFQSVGRDKALPFPAIIKTVHGELVEPSS